MFITALLFAPCSAVYIDRGGGTLSLCPILASAAQQCMLHDLRVSTWLKSPGCLRADHLVQCVSVRCGKVADGSLRVVATLFELLYLFFPEGPMRVAYDNGCSFLAYALNGDAV